jgi:hypothetical protein
VGSPILFLDIDGVLVRAYQKPDGSWYANSEPDRACVTYLNAITDLSGAAIVVSSSWRIKGADEVCAILKGWGVTGDVIGITPVLSDNEYVPRGDEIKTWFEIFIVPDNTPFVILDDNDDMGDLGCHLVQTDSLVGLTRENAWAALDKLRGVGRRNSAAEMKERVRRWVRAVG